MSNLEYPKTLKEFRQKFSTDQSCLSMAKNASILLAIDKTAQPREIMRTGVNQISN